MLKNPHASRKADHIRINLEEDVAFHEITTGLERYRFVHQALPELDLAEVNTSHTFLGKTLRAPLLISCMTGGTPKAEAINQRLAGAAQALGVAMGVGSQRVSLEDPQAARHHQVRQVAPDILLFANLGAVQLNYGYGIDHCRRAVEMVEADALVLHLNPLQEAVQPEGNTNFAGLLRKIERVCRVLPVPVIAKEVGWGISDQTARRLAEVGVAAIDVAGAGGTCWSKVEQHRMKSPTRRRVAESFSQWGIPTAEALVLARQGAPGLPLIASGGIRTGVDAAKGIALGADLVGLASPMLKAAARSYQAVEDLLLALIDELRIAMFCVGAATVIELQHTPHLVQNSREAAPGGGRATIAGLNRSVAG